MREQGKAAIPALLYAFNNQLAFWMLLQMDPGTMQLLSNFKIVPTVLLSVLFLKKEISSTQYKAIVLLLLGMIALHSADGDLKVGSTYLGLCQAFIYCMVSAVAGLWCEKVLREGSLHTQNFHLYIWGCVVNTAWLVLHLKPDSITGLQDGWAIANIFNQALTGLLISVVLKYAGNVDKLFVTAGSVIPAGLAAHYLFGYEITEPWLTSAGIIVTAIIMYVSNGEKHNRTLLLAGLGCCAIGVALFSETHEFHAMTGLTFASTTTKSTSLQIPAVILHPSQHPNYTLGFLQTLCQHEDHPFTRSCFHYPTDLWPDTPEFAPYKNKSILHFQDFLNDEFHGVSWCQNTSSAPCRWHHHVSLMSYAMCMLTRWDITFFLDTGGLIGTLRNGGFELTDHDLDFAAWIPDQGSISRLKEMQDEASLLAAASENAPSNVTITVVVNGRIHVNFLSSVNGASFLGHVDVWRFNVTEGNHSNVRTPAWPDGTGIDKENLFPLGQCNFMGKVVPCPNRPYSFLKQWYHLKNSDLFVSPGTKMYSREASLASSNRSMNCLEHGGFPTLRRGTVTKKPFFAASDTRGRPLLSE